MKRQLTAFVAASALFVAACSDLSNQQANEIGAGAFGAGAAAIAASALFDASAGWVVVAAAAGAAAGVLIARNSQTNQCAYSDGNGGTVTRPC